MNIDFSALNSISKTPGSHTDAVEATRTDEKPKGIESSIKSIETAVKGNTAPTESIGSKALINLTHEQEDHKRSAAVYQAYQSNTKIAEQLQSEILKGAQSGADTTELLLKAVECISRMTGNTAFYEQVRANIKK